MKRRIGTANLRTRTKKKGRDRGSDSMALFSLAHNAELAALATKIAMAGRYGKRRVENGFQGGLVVEMSFDVGDEPGLVALHRMHDARGELMQHIHAGIIADRGTEVAERLGERPLPGRPRRRVRDR